MNRTDELRTARIESLVTPAELALRYPVTPGVATHVTDSRRRIEKILNGEDKRLLVIIGPCSIHDLTAAMEYATRLPVAAPNQYQSRLEIVMRTYFEKPRTVVGCERTNLRSRFKRQLSGKSRSGAGAQITFTGK
ncbi:phospho-2-dehydro-3-deoxyheptonate aldolase [Escherichia coli]|uniref:Phospho-2-dehydro-3-deoxyheptonate aldolase, Trp-sensitive n=1 Tax=Escherichia coli TaxID=562 RepID=A0A2X1QBW2_ECOLX|nr:phospho-2-dehydro-3-deoxyheptonate aldolase [Escherichia coli]